AFSVGESDHSPRKSWNSAAGSGFLGYLIEITADNWVRKLDTRTTWKRMKTPAHDRAAPGPCCRYASRQRRRAPAGHAGRGDRLAGPETGRPLLRRHPGRWRTCGRGPGEVGAGRPADRSRP